MRQAAPAQQQEQQQQTWRQQQADAAGSSAAHPVQQTPPLFGQPPTRPAAAPVAFGAGSTVGPGPGADASNRPHPGAQAAPPAGAASSGAPAGQERLNFPPAPAGLQPASLPIPAPFTFMPNGISQAPGGTGQQAPLFGPAAGTQGQAGFSASQPASVSEQSAGRHAESTFGAQASQQPGLAPSQEAPGKQPQPAFVFGHCNDQQAFSGVGQQASQAPQQEPFSFPAFGQPQGAGSGQTPAFVFGQSQAQGAGPAEKPHSSATRGPAHSSPAKRPHSAHKARQRRVPSAGWPCQTRSVLLLRACTCICFALTLQQAMSWSNLPLSSQHDPAADYAVSVRGCCYVALVSEITACSHLSIALKSLDHCSVLQARSVICSVVVKQEQHVSLPKFVLQPGIVDPPMLMPGTASHHAWRCLELNNMRPAGKKGTSYAQAAVDKQAQRLSRRRPYAGEAPVGPEDVSSEWDFGRWVVLHLACCPALGEARLLSGQM